MTPPSPVDLIKKAPLKGGFTALTRPGGVISGCSLNLAARSLTLSFDVKSRKLAVRAYNRSNVALSATAVLVKQSSAKWVPVPVSAGPPSSFKTPQFDPGSRYRRGRSA